MTIKQPIVALSQLAGEIGADKPVRAWLLDAEGADPLAVFKLGAVSKSHDRETQAPIAVLKLTNS
jgi:hypothetical protein